MTTKHLCRNCGSTLAYTDDEKHVYCVIPNCVQHNIRHPVSTPVESTLKQRNTTHGDYRGMSVIAQSIKYVLHQHENWQDLSAQHREALDHIATKMARIVNGDPNYKDNWHDIQGYAKLGEEACQN